MKKLVFATMLVTGCVAAPARSPMEAYLNRYAGAEAVSSNCPAVGGYGSVSQMRADAQSNLARARRLGATDADIAKARSRVGNTLTTSIILVGDYEACNAFINNLAWAGTIKPEISNKKPR